MVDVLYPANAVSGAPAYSGRMIRQAQSVFLAGATAARPLGARSGVRPGTSLTTVTATSTTWSCGPFAGVADVEAAAESGPYEFAFDASASGTLTSADASNPRIDIIYVQVSDPAEGDGSTAPLVARGYLAGTAAATPAAPAAPARSFVVAQINVPKAGGGNPTVTWVAPYAVAAGAPTPFTTLALLKTWTTAGPQQRATVFGDATVGNNGDYVWSGSAWVLVNSVPTFTDITTFGTGWTALNTSNYKPRIRRQGNSCVLHGGVTAGTGATLGNLFTIPTALQPASTTSRFVGAGITSNGQQVGYELVNGVIGIPVGYGGSGLTGAGVNHLLRLAWELDQ